MKWIKVGYFGYFGYWVHYCSLVEKCCPNSFHQHKKTRQISHPDEKPYGVVQGKCCSHFLHHSTKNYRQISHPDEKPYGVVQGKCCPIFFYHSTKNYRQILHPDEKPLWRARGNAVQIAVVIFTIIIIFQWHLIIFWFLFYSVKNPMNMADQKIIMFDQVLTGLKRLGNSHSCHRFVDLSKTDQAVFGCLHTHNVSDDHSISCIYETGRWTLVHQRQ